MPVAISSKRARLSIELEQRVVFTHNDASTSALEQLHQQAAVNGHVVLALTAPSTRVSRVNIDFVGRSQLWASATDLRESHTFADSSASVVIDETLPAGTWRWPFSFSLPQDAVPTLASPFCESKLKLRANTTIPGRLSSTTLRAKEDVVVAIEPELSEDAEAEETATQAYMEDIGVVLLRMASKRHAVSSLAVVDFSLLSPPADLRLTSLRVSVRQASVAHYRDGHAVRTPPIYVDLFEETKFGKACDGGKQKAKVDKPWRAGTVGDMRTCAQMFRKGPTDLEAVEAGREWHYTRLFRVPPHIELTPSAPPTRHGLEVGHKLVLELRYCIGEEGKEKYARIDLDMKLDSCWCRLHAVQLPEYSEEPRAVLPGCLRECLCHEPIEKLLSVGYMPTLSEGKHLKDLFEWQRHENAWKEATSST